MKWTWLFFMVCLIGTTGNVLGQEPVPASSAPAGPIGDPWTDSVIPSGMRFMEPTMVRTGGYSYANLGIPGLGNMPPCGICGSGGMCIHWSMLPWYARWPSGPHGGHCGARSCYRCGGY